MKRLPQVLALHLKRFKYMEQLQRYKKLSYRVDFPIDLGLQTTADLDHIEDRDYKLFAVVVHIGNGPSHGHYVSIIRCHDTWFLFDDENVEPIEQDALEHCFGHAQVNNLHLLLLLLF
jgi:ubiquitin C-terminal hydrolase